MIYKLMKNQLNNYRKQERSKEQCEGFIAGYTTRQLEQRSKGCATFILGMIFSAVFSLIYIIFS